MSPTTQLYLKTFLFTAILYGLLMYTFDITLDYEIKVGKLLLMSVFFGFAMSSIQVSFHIDRLKTIGVQEMTRENLGVNQSRILKSNLNIAELISKLKTDPVIRRMTIKDTSNGILLDTGKSWNWWTEEIKILIKTGQDSDFKYIVSSRPKNKLTFIDNGKNLENINRIEKAVKN